jgi:hypothetical protein
MALTRNMTNSITKDLNQKKKAEIIKPKTISELFKERNKKIKNDFRFEKSKRKKKNVEKTRDLSKYHIKYNALFRAYLDNIESITDNQICAKQRGLIEKALKNKEYRRITPEQNKQHRIEYNANKAKLIEEWERQTCKEWGRYKEDIYNKNGKLIRRKGNLYDFHHIILSSYKGDNAWWNGFPAKHPNEHPNAIHHKDGVCSKIFK